MVGCRYSEIAGCRAALTCVFAPDSVGETSPCAGVPRVAHGYHSTRLSGGSSMAENEKQIPDGLAPEEIEAETAEALPERAAMSTVNVTGLDAATGAVDA